jgi:hypothetical protein
LIHGFKLLKVNLEAKKEFELRSECVITRRSASQHSESQSVPFFLKARKEDLSKKSSKEAFAIQGGVRDKKIEGPSYENDDVFILMFSEMFHMIPDTWCEVKLHFPTENVYSLKLVVSITKTYYWDIF